MARTEQNLLKILLCFWRQFVLNCVASILKFAWFLLSICCHIFLTNFALFLPGFYQQHHIHMPSSVSNLYSSVDKIYIRYFAESIFNKFGYLVYLCKYFLFHLLYYLLTLMLYNFLWCIISNKNLFQNWNYSKLCQKFNIKFNKNNIVCVHVCAYACI